MGNTLKSFLAAFILIIFSLSIWAFNGYMVFGWSLPRQEAETSPKWQLERQSGTPQAGLSAISGNSLFPISHLPPTPETHVFAALVGNEEVLINNYCDWDYLKQWWPERDLSAATKVCYCESGGDPETINDTPRVEYSVGLWQVNLLSHKKYTEEEMKDPVKNTLAAIKIYQDPKTGGWQNWWNCAHHVGVLP